MRIVEFGRGVWVVPPSERETVKELPAVKDPLMRIMVGKALLAWGWISWVAKWPGSAARCWLKIRQIRREKCR